MKLEIAAVVCGVLCNTFAVASNEVMASVTLLATVALMVAGLVT